MIGLVYKDLRSRVARRSRRSYSVMKKESKPHYSMWWSAIGLTRSQEKSLYRCDGIVFRIDGESYGRTIPSYRCNATLVILTIRSRCIPGN